MLRCRRRARTERRSLARSSGRSPRIFASRRSFRSCPRETAPICCCTSRNAPPIRAGSPPRSRDSANGRSPRWATQDLKDRHAITAQWFSVPGRPQSGGILERACARTSSGCSSVHANARKLKRGALSGNRFRIRLRKVDLVPRAAGLEARGAARSRCAQLFRSAALRPRRIQSRSGRSVDAERDAARGARRARIRAFGGARPHLQCGAGKARAGGGLVGPQAGRSRESRGQRQPLCA